MSRKKNNKDQDQFDSQNGANMQDAFEKEAAEGFAMLDSAAEIDAAKKELDERIYKEVFVKKQKRQVLVYWTAAAGLLFLIGFAVYFVNETSKDNALAIHVQEPKTAELAKPALSETAPAQMAAPLATDVKAETFKGIALDSVSAGPAEPVKALNKKDESAARVVAMKKAYENSSKNEWEGAASGAGAGDVAAPPVMTAASAESAAPENEDDFAAPAAKEDVAGNADLAINEDKIVKEEKVTAVSTRKSKSRTDEEVQLAPASVPMPTTFNAGPPGNICAYKGGDKKLHEDVTKLLDDSLRKSFDVKLTINKKGEVSNAIILQGKDLSAEQKLLITQKLKKLSDFDCTNVQGQNYPVEYMYAYRP